MQLRIRLRYWAFFEALQLKIVKIFLILIINVLSPFFSLSQIQGPQLLGPIKKYQIPIYPLPEPGEMDKIVLYFSYAKPEISNPEILRGLDPDRIEGVDLVFTRYPYRFEEWRTDYDWLLQARLGSLEKEVPSIFPREDVKWRFVLQTDCQTEPEAISMFHGLVLHIGPPKSNELYTRLQELRSKNPYLDDIARIVYGESGELQDSTLYYVMARHPEWQNMLVVMDWTSSMYENGASVIRWYREHFNEQSIKHLVLFNDGNSKHYSHKRVGKTGGIYYVTPSNIEKVLLTMLKVRKAGIGGDAPENDIEALLIATQKLKDYNEVILIADRNSSVRDIRLLTRLKKPIHIILFNQKGPSAANFGQFNSKKENIYIHPHYLTLASMTAGSIHLNERNIENLDQIAIGDQYYWGDIIYEKMPNGAFRQVQQ